MANNDESFRDKCNAFMQCLDSIVNTDDTPMWIKPCLVSLKTFAAEITNNFEVLEGKLAVQQAVTNALKDDRDQLQKDVRELEITLEDQLQYSRRTCLLIHGIPEVESKGKQQEDTDKAVLDLFENTLQAGVSKWDIGRSHRLGRRKHSSNGSKPSARPIIVRFVSYRQRKAVFDVKKKLKGKKFSITESLTKKGYALFQKCIEAYGYNNVWTFDGRINCIKDDTKIVVTTEEDLIQHVRY